MRLRKAHAGMRIQQITTAPHKVALGRRAENDGPRGKGAARRPERPALSENLRIV